MFINNMLYSLKMMIRAKDVILWLFLFPIVLATVFYFAFWKVSATEIFTKAKIAVYNLESNEIFEEVLAQVSNSDGTAEKDDIFEVTKVTKDEGERLVKEGKIDGFIIVGENDNLSFVTGGLDIKGTVVKTFLNTYLSNAGTMKNTAGVLETSHIVSVLRNAVEIETKQISKNAVNQNTTYFYALLGMVCFYFGIAAVEIVKMSQSKCSLVAARQNVSPTSRRRIFLMLFTGLVLCCVLIIFIMLGYIGLVLGVPLGNFGLVLLACLIGMFSSIGIGCLMGVLPLKQNAKNILMIIFGLILSMLTGLMGSTIKETIVQKAPFVNYINPVALISDSLHALYYYDGLSPFFIRIGILCGYAVLFMGLSFLLIRRKKYAYI